MIDYEKLKTRRGLWKKTEQPGYIKKKCGVDGCPTKHYTQGYCAKHYCRLKKHGDLNAVNYHYTNIYPTLEDYFHKNTIKETNGCWIWTGTKLRRGYGGVGSTRWGKQFKIYSAHRLSYFYYKGEIPEGIFVCHSCDNPSCINPDHLFLGTHEDNMRDMINKARKGNKFGEEGANAKLTKEQAIYILQNMETITAWELSMQFNVCRQTIQNIWRGITKYIKPELREELMKDQSEDNLEMVCEHDPIHGYILEEDEKLFKKCSTCGAIYQCNL